MQITLDNQPVNITEGQTILDAARSAGVDIPALCFREQVHCRFTPASCQVCLVRLNGKQFVPSCATKAEDGMVIESECDEVRQLRKTALELLLSEHYGDCVAPCQSACPAGLEIPKVIRAIQQNDWTEAAEIIRQSIQSVNCAVDCGNCAKPCEKVCRRKGLDNSIAIQKLTGEVAAKVPELQISGGEPVSVKPAIQHKPQWSVRRNKPSKEYLQTMADFAAQLKINSGQEASAPHLTDNEFIQEAARCLHCDCLGREKCLLLRYAALYKAETRRFSGSSSNNASNKTSDMPPVVSGKIAFEPGKCIRCGVCIAVAEKNGEETGLAFTGRGYDVKIGVPFERPLETALKHSADEAAAMCPTGALKTI